MLIDGELECSPSLCEFPLGLVLLGQGVVRLGIRKTGLLEQKTWTRVTAVALKSVYGLSMVSKTINSYDRAYYHPDFWGRQTS